MCGRTHLIGGLRGEFVLSNTIFIEQNHHSFCGANCKLFSVWRPTNGSDFTNARGSGLVNGFKKFELHSSNVFGSLVEQSPFPRLMAKTK